MSQTPIGSGQGPLGKMYAVKKSDGITLVAVKCNDAGELIVSNDAPQTVPTPLANSSGNVAAAAAVATLHPPTGKTASITRFDLGASGATTALPVTATVVGVVGGPLSYTFVFPAGALLAAAPVVAVFDPPLPATGPDVDIVVTLPSGGTGNTHATASAAGLAE